MLVENIASESVGSRLIMLHAPSLLVADEGAELDLSRETSLEMDDSPVIGEASPPSTMSTVKSLWQNNLVAFRLDRFINWKLARAGVVKWLDNANYGG